MNPQVQAAHDRAVAAGSEFYTDPDASLAERVLVGVDEISWIKKADAIETSGGRQRVWRHWELEPTDSSLIPIRYRYFVPDGGDNFGFLVSRLYQSH